MQYIEFRKQFEDFLVFSFADIKKADPSFYRSRLAEWQDKGYIKKIIRGHYMFSDAEINELALFFAANKMYAPSYISFEMALSHYRFIPESVYGITSATSKKTCAFSTPLGEFSYRGVKPSLMFGYKLLPYKQYAVKIAEPEKAILDYLYVNPRLRTEHDFIEMRVNADEFSRQIDLEKLNAYLERFHNQSLKKRVRRFLKLIYHA